MSRVVRLPVEARVGAVGEPRAVRAAGWREWRRVRAVLSCWREWIGVNEGEPERDVWRVELAADGAGGAPAPAVCELHCVRFLGGEGEDQGEGAWTLHRWED